LTPIDPSTGATVGDLLAHAEQQPGFPDLRGANQQGDALGDDLGHGPARLREVGRQQVSVTAAVLLLLPALFGRNRRDSRGVGVTVGHGGRSGVGVGGGGGGGGGRAGLAGATVEAGADGGGDLIGGQSEGDAGGVQLGLRQIGGDLPGGDKLARPEGGGVQGGVALADLGLGQACHLVGQGGLPVGGRAPRRTVGGGSREDRLGGRRRPVVEQATEIAGQITWGPPKSGKARTVRLPRFICTELAAYLADRPHRPDDLVFTMPEGGVLRQSTLVREHFRPALRRAGLPEGLRFHDLRHTAASLMIASGANVKVVQRQLGHASAAMTLDTYAGLFPEDLDAVADRLDHLHAAAASETGANGGAEVGQEGTVRPIVAAQRP
jgi:hypothetical protein